VARVHALESVRRRLLDRDKLDALRASAAQIERWAPGSHAWGHYAEEIDGRAAICRTENVSTCVPSVAAVVEGTLRRTASEALGEDATAFKDKINYKQPRGAGFRPHQDRVAYPGVDCVLSILVALDPCTEESGCLWMAAGIDEVLATDDRGVVLDEVVQQLHWTPVLLEPGDAVLLDGLAPHFSEANRSTSARRVLVASYAPAREGYAREQYYDARGEAMERASAGDGRFRISTLADFEGIEVEAPSTARGCVHPAVA
jgi:2-aminoethylphosphonate dioxygenase